MKFHAKSMLTYLKCPITQIYQYQIFYTDKKVNAISLVSSWKTTNLAAIQILSPHPINDITTSNIYCTFSTRKLLP